MDAIQGQGGPIYWLSMTLTNALVGSGNQAAGGNETRMMEWSGIDVNLESEVELGSMDT